MRKILNPKFWSHGTPLGSLGPLSQQDPDKIFSNYQILVIWGPYKPNIPLACESHAKNLKPSYIMMCCVIFVRIFSWISSCHILVTGYIPTFSLLLSQLKQRYTLLFSCSTTVRNLGPTTLI